MLHVSLQYSYVDSVVQKRSPLTPRNPNACPRFSASMNSKESLPVTAERRRRLAQNHPLQCTPERSKDQRRLAFLSKVRQASDDKRWETRGEQILRQDFLMRQKQWMEEQATSAPPEHPSPGESPDEPPKNYDVEEIDMVDQILSQEDEECLALVCLMNEAKEAAENDKSNDPEENMLKSQVENMSEFGSEAEDYDRLFMDLTLQQDQQAQQVQTPILQGGHCSSPRAHEMDVSLD